MQIFLFELQISAFSIEISALNEYKPKRIAIHRDWYELKRSFLRTVRFYETTAIYRILLIVLDIDIITLFVKGKKALNMNF